MNALVLLLTLTTTTLVLQSGERIAVEGKVRQENGVVVFRSNGVLYSMPAAEIARIDEAPAATEERPVRRLRVSDEERKRLIEQLEKNHSGTPAPPMKMLEEPRPLPPEPDPSEEAHWRAEARAHEENVRRAKEELELLERRADELRQRIHALLNQGFRPRHFTYDTTQLARIEEQIPYAKLEVARAERAWNQFREDARRAGVLPGWLR